MVKRIAGWPKLYKWLAAIAGSLIVAAIMLGVTHTVSGSNLARENKVRLDEKCNQVDRNTEKVDAVEKVLYDIQGDIKAIRFYIEHGAVKHGSSDAGRKVP